MGVKIERHGPAAVVVLDWPEQRNALGPDDARAVAVALREAAADPDARGVVLTGEGAFCAGGNLKGKMFQQESSAEQRTQELYSGVHELMRAIVDVPLPTVAAIDGPAIALGFDMALACDSRFIGPDGWCLQGWGKLGFVPGAGGELLLRLRSPNALWALLETQPRIDAAYAERLGLGESTNGSRARERAIARVQALAAMSRESLMAYVELNRAELRERLDAALPVAAKKQIALLAASGLNERISAALKR